MKSEKAILKAMNDIRDDYIEEAAPRGYLPKTERASVFSWMNMRVLAGAFAVLMLAVFGTFLRPKNSDVQTVRPYTVCQTLQEAEKITGFSLDVPDSMEGWKISSISVYNGTMTEVQYADTDGETVLRVRKAEGSDDISGDYNTYPEETEFISSGRTVTASGENGNVQLMVWTGNGFSYSVSLSEPVSIETAESIADQIR